MFPESSSGLHHFLLSQIVAPASVQLWLPWERSGFTGMKTIEESYNSKEYSNSYELIMVKSEKEGEKGDLVLC